MRLAAVYCVWGDCLDLLRKSVENILPVVDQVILIASRSSNFGQVLNYEFDLLNIVQSSQGKTVVFWQEPNPTKRASENECEKRAFGLLKARELKMTHFVMMDSDEFYDRQEFAEEAMRIEAMGIEGAVCRVQTYIKEPTLTIGLDHTLVPFIHQITPYLRYKLDARRYPFAYDEHMNPHIDPTRRFNLVTSVEISKIIMHHYSYVRENIDLKIQNSTANLRRSAEVIHREMNNACPGYKSELYHKEIFECVDRFKIKGPVEKLAPTKS